MSLSPFTEPFRLRLGLSSLTIERKRPALSKVSRILKWQKAFTSPIRMISLIHFSTMSFVLSISSVKSKKMAAVVVRPSNKPP